MFKKHTWEKPKHINKKVKIPVVAELGGFGDWDEDDESVHALRNREIADDEDLNDNGFGFKIKVKKPKFKKVFKSVTKIVSAPVKIVSKVASPVTRVVSAPVRMVGRVTAPITRPIAKIARPITRPIAKITRPITRPISRLVKPAVGFAAGGIVGAASLVGAQKLMTKVTNPLVGSSVPKARTNYVEADESYDSEESSGKSYPVSTSSASSSSSSDDDYSPAPISVAQAKSDDHEVDSNSPVVDAPQKAQEKAKAEISQAKPAMGTPAKLALLGIAAFVGYKTFGE